MNGPLILDDAEIMIRAAIDGVGLAFMLEERAAPHIASGALVRVLEDWCPPLPDFFLYYHPGVVRATAGARQRWPLWFQAVGRGE